MLTAKELVKYYTYVTEWDADDEIFIARCAEWESLSAHGTSPINALLELMTVLIDCIEDCRENDESYPQPFNTPMPRLLN